MTAARLLLFFALCPISLLFAGVPVPHGLFGPSASEASVRQLVQKYVAAREQQDPNQVRALFTADADQLVSSGEWRKGREALVEGTMASSKRTGGTRTITVESVRFLSPDIAIADGHYDLAWIPKLSWVTSAQVSDKNGGWKNRLGIVVFHEKRWFCYRTSG